MKVFVNAWSEQYNAQRYPLDFYCQCIKKIRTTEDSSEFARYVIAMLHWKDGKVTKNNLGDFFLDGLVYSLGTPKPNTYNPLVHKQTLESSNFFTWGKTLIKRSDFDVNQLKRLTGMPFSLWAPNALVIPSFILHILSPWVYPLYDQHVERAIRALNAEKQLNKNSTPLSIDSYKAYKTCFDTVLAEYYDSRTDISLEEIKTVDNALWSFGKWLKNIEPGRYESDRGSFKAKSSAAELPNVIETDLQQPYNGTFEPDQAFKQRVMQLISQGNTQANAMRLVSTERNVKLAESYYRYPGSHIHRWRHQGF